MKQVTLRDPQIRSDDDPLMAHLKKVSPHKLLIAGEQGATPDIVGAAFQAASDVLVGNLTAGLGKKPYMRKVLTSVFLHEARARGLDCAILNPDHYVPVESLDAHDAELGRKVILDHDMNAFEELEEIALRKKTGTVDQGNVNRIRRIESGGEYLPENQGRIQAK